MQPSCSPVHPSTAHHPRQHRHTRKPFLLTNCTAYFILFVSYFTWLINKGQAANHMALTLTHSKSIVKAFNIASAFISWSIIIHVYRDPCNSCLTSVSCNSCLFWVFSTGLLLQLEDWKLIKIYLQVLSLSRPYQALTISINKMKQFGFWNFHFLEFHSSLSPCWKLVPGRRRPAHERKVKVFLPKRARQKDILGLLWMNMLPFRLRGDICQDCQ